MTALLLAGTWFYCCCCCCFPLFVQQVHGGQLLKISSQAEDDFVRFNLLWTGFFGETCKRAD